LGKRAAEKPPPDFHALRELLSLTQIAALQLYADSTSSSTTASCDLVFQLIFGAKSLDLGFRKTLAAFPVEDKSPQNPYLPTPQRLLRTDIGLREP
jgi:hypothetical protein